MEGFLIARDRASRRRCEVSCPLRTEVASGSGIIFWRRLSLTADGSRPRRGLGCPEVELPQQGHLLYQPCHG